MANQLLQGNFLPVNNVLPLDFSMCLWSFAVSAVIGYLMGSLPAAWITVRLISGKNSDIRSLGDGNVGATNAGRLMGARWGILVAGVDMAKGYGAISVSRLVESPVCTYGLEQPLSAFAMVAGASAMAGHIWPVWLRFQGGRGAATAVGILGTTIPGPTLLMAFPTVLVLLITRNTSLAFGVIFLWSLVIGKVLFHVSWLFVWYSPALFVLVALTDPRLRRQRILDGRAL